MKIAIDARWIFKEISGVGTYTREIISELVRIDNSNDYIVIFNDTELLKRESAQTGIDEAANFKAVLFTHGVFSISSQLKMPGFLQKQKVDVFHSTNYMIPLFAFPKRKMGNVKCVTTIHDVIPLVFPDHAPKSKKSRMFWLYKAIMKCIGAKSDIIIAVSECSKTDIIKHLAIPSADAGKVHVVYNGISEKFKQSKTESNSDNEQGKTILYVGRFDPYKNVETLVRAFSKATKRCDFPLTLTIAGSADPRYPGTQKLVRELGIEDRIDFTGYLTGKELVSLYQKADLLVHPSRYEGFGLQIAEAFACGLPVICSNAGSLPEVAGEAAITLDPDDVSGFEEKIIEVLTTKELSNKMIRDGLKQVSQYNWKESARQTMALYMGGK